MSAFRYRLKLVPRQRPNYEGDWIEVETARPAPGRFLNATRFFAPFHTPDLMLVAIEQIRPKGDPNDQA